MSSFYEREPLLLVRYPINNLQYTAQFTCYKQLYLSPSPLQGMLMSYILTSRTTSRGERLKYETMVMKCSKFYKWFGLLNHFSTFARTVLFDNFYRAGRWRSKMFKLKERLIDCSTKVGHRKYVIILKDQRRMVCV